MSAANRLYWICRGPCGSADVRTSPAPLMETQSVLAALADLVLLPTDAGGLKAAMETPCRSLLLHTDAGPGTGLVTVGVSISTTSGEPLTPGTSAADARLDFWVDLVELYLVPGQDFQLRYPTRIVGRGLVTSVFPAEG